MSRPREFDVEDALHQCMKVFWTKGFKSTSFDDLTCITNVKKQSLYGVFKDKRNLFLQALSLYREQTLAVIEEIVSQGMSPIRTLEVIRDVTLGEGDESVSRGCLMVNTALEFGSEDEAVRREVERMFVEIERILEKVIQSGQEQQLITCRHTSHELAVHLQNTLLGAKMMEKSGASRERIEILLRTSFALIAP